MDADRKKITWEILYTNIYLTTDKTNNQNEIIRKGWEFWSLFDFTSPQNGNCKIKASNNTKDLKIDDPKIKDFTKFFTDFEISGDADWGGGIIIGKAKHQFSNFSLIPVTGGMNSKKGCSYNDSLDWFIYKLSQYYLLGDIKRISFANEFLWYNVQYPKCSNGIITLGYLVAYLNLFNDVYDYCEKIYLISDYDYVNSLIQHGKTTEVNGISREKEIKLAKEYFNYKSTKLKLILSHDLHNYLSEDINADNHK